MALQKYSSLPTNKVVGMAGILDTARFSTFIAEELDDTDESVNAYVVGGHGDTMVPVIGATNVGGVPVEKMIEKNKLESIVQRTRDGGAEIVALLKTGSAFYAPSAAIVQMIEAILLDKNQILPCAVLLNGEYGFNDVYAGVPVKLGAEGVEEIIEVELNSDEKSALSKSVDSVIELLEIMEENS
jgi:malate dehydrogenase